MSRRLTTTLFGGLVPILLFGSIGCDAGDDQLGDQEQLAALLRDKDLTLTTRSALSTGAGGAAGAAPTGAAGTTGVAGTGPAGTGVAGPGVAGQGPPITGTAGTGPASSGIAGTTGIAGTGPAGTGVLPDGGVMTGSAGVTGAAGVTGVAGTGMVIDGGMTGKAGGGGGSGGPIPGGPPVGKWDFDDCNQVRTDLQDVTFQGHTAFRSVGTQCSMLGIDGQGVQIAKKEDIVYVPDQPNFVFDGGVTVAGWFNPTSNKQTRSLLRKRDQGTSSFALLLNDGNYQFVISLGNGRAASVSAPKKAKVNAWAHVAGTYDNAFLRLYIDGVEVTKLKVKGVIPPGPGPLLMGNDGSERRFDGIMDTTVFDTRAESADEIMALTCLRRMPGLVATPAVSQPTPAGTPAVFDIAIKNNNTASCPPAAFIFETQFGAPGIFVEPQFSFFPPVGGGQTQHLSLSVTANDDPDPGTFTIPFIAADVSGNKGGFVQSSVDFVLAASGCRVSRPRELMITSLTVVDDLERTTGSGVWTFKHLMEEMAPTPEAAPAMVEEMLSTFLTPQTVNGFTIEARPGMQTRILAQWPRTLDGALDLSQAPVRLEAIVNRFDLRNVAAGDAGEGRFVFGFQPPQFPFPLQATIILEYKLPATTGPEALAWANRWHALGALMQGTPEYNAALEAITEGFAKRGARSGHVNGSAINAVRTNEIDFGENGIWQLREFGLSAATGKLVPHTIALTPDLSFKDTDVLASFINENEASIIAETDTVPDTFKGAAFATGAVFNDLSPWTAPGIANNEARHHFSLNTCNGCHSGAETGTRFLQIQPRFPGGEAGLAGFLTGITVSDPVTFEPRTFNDLARRATDLKTIVCPDSVTPPPPSPPPTGDGGVTPVPMPIGMPPKAMTTLMKGISRVH